MKTYNNLYNQICSQENLYKAYLKARKGKRYNKEVMAFTANLEQNLATLQSELMHQTYTHGSYREFMVSDSKKRLIKAAPFRDRVVHHAIYAVVEPIFDKSFIYHSYACRKGKGTHLAVKNLRRMTKSSKAKYCLQCDISKYFDSIDHGVLMRMLSDKLADQKTLDLLKLVLASTFAKVLPNGQKAGIPIGNLTSQLFANIYLTRLDRFIKHDLHQKLYIRYMDDFLILGPAKELLHTTKERIRDFVQTGLRLLLHPKKAVVYPVSVGVDFLGYVLKEKVTLVRKSTVRRFVTRMAQDKKLVDAGFMARNKYGAGVRCFMNYTSYANAWNLRVALCRVLMVAGFILGAGVFSLAYSQKAYAGYETAKFNQGYNTGGAFYLDAGNIGAGVQTVSFWLSGTTGGNIMDFNGTQYVAVSGAGAITLTGITGTVYVDGATSSTVPDSNWHFVVITTATDITASAVKFGSLEMGNFDGTLDEVKFYSYALSAREVAEKYRQGSPTMALGGTINGDLRLVGDAYFTEDLHLTGALYDTSDSAGTDGQYLKSTATGTAWTSFSAGVDILPTGTEGQMLYNNAGVWTAFSDMYWKDSSGSLGIGTTSPSYKLDIAGTLGVGSTAYFASLVGIGTTAPSEELEIVGDIKLSGASPKIVSTTGLDLDLGDAAGSYSFDIRDSGETNLLSLDSLGSLTLNGQTGSSATFNLTPSGTTDAFTINRSGAGTGFAFRVNDAGAGDTSPFIITNAGNVGVGTTGPTGKFQVTDTYNVLNDLATGGTSYSFNEANLGALLVDEYAFDDNTISPWAGTSGIAQSNGWLAYKFASGTVVSTIKTYPYPSMESVNFKNFSIQASNDSTDGSDGSWTTLASGLDTSDTAQWDEFTFSNSTSYTWYRLYGPTQFVAGYGIFLLAVVEVEMGVNVPTTSTPLFVSDTSGAVGIQTVNPLTLLSLGSTAYTFAKGGLSFGDMDTGLYESADDWLNIRIGDYDKVTINSSGLVGIGTTAPEYTLDVVGPERVTGHLKVVGTATSGQEFLLHVDNSEGRGLDTVYDYDNDTWRIRATGAEQAIAFNQTGTEVMRITPSTHYVGIGTTAPTYQLETTGTLGVGSTAYFASLVGIGTTAPGYSLEVSGGDIYTSGDLRVAGDDIFMATNTANYFLMADGANYNPTSPADARTGLGLVAGGTGDIWVEKAGDTMTGNLTFNKADSSIIFDTLTATDTDFWLGVQDDAGGDDDDLFMIGDGATPGTNSFLTINSSGYVGIGTTAPVALLEVMGATNQLQLSYDASNYNIWSVASDGTLTHNNNGTNIATYNTAGISFKTPTSFDTAGDVSMAYNLVMSNPVSSGITFEGAGTIATSHPSSNYNLTLTAANAGTVIVDDTLTLSGIVMPVADATSALRFQSTAGSDILTLDTTNGRVGIGTTAPASALEVTGETRITGLASADYYVCVDAEGDLFESATACSGSDIRLKENITPLASALDGVLALNPITFKWKDTQKSGAQLEVGFIAQEMEKIFPQVVRTNPDGYKGIKYDVFSAILTKAVQEQELKLAGLADQVQTLTTLSETPQNTPTSESDFILTGDMYQSMQDNLSTLGNKMLGVDDFMAKTNQNLASLTSSQEENSKQIAQIQSLLAILGIRDSTQSSEASESSQSAGFAGILDTNLLTSLQTVYDNFVQLVEALGLMQVDGELVVESAMTVLGDAGFANVDISGDLRVGLLEVNSLENSINIVGPSCVSGQNLDVNDELCQSQTIYLQKNLAGNIDLFNGAIIFSPDGNIAAEEIDAKKLVAQVYGVTSIGQSVGEGIIPAGETNIAITSSTAQSDYKVFVTATSNTEGVELFVKEKAQGEFIVALSGTSAIDIKFDWWVVQVD